MIHPNKRTVAKTEKQRRSSIDSSVSQHPHILKYVQVHAACPAFPQSELTWLLKFRCISGMTYKSFSLTDSVTKVAFICIDTSVSFQKIKR